MPDWLLWAAAILLAVSAGWAWNEWRGRSRAPGRPRTDRAPDRRRPDRAPPGRDRPDRARPGRNRPAGPATRTPGRPGTAPRPRGADRGATGSGTPRPGEIWWAEVPYADGTGAKVRPCLVLRVDGRGADVLKITSQDKSDRDDHVRIPTRDWDRDADHDSFLDIGEPIRVARSAFDNRAGTVAPHLWHQLRSLPHLSLP
jgi:hypothetical protein